MARLGIKGSITSFFNAWIAGIFVTSLSGAKNSTYHKCSFLMKDADMPVDLRTPENTKHLIFQAIMDNQSRYFAFFTTLLIGLAGLGGSKRLFAAFKWTKALFKSLVSPGVDSNFLFSFFIIISALVIIFFLGCLFFALSINSVIPANLSTKLEIRNFKPEISATGKLGYLLYGVSGLGLILLKLYATLLLMTSLDMITGPKSIAAVLFVFAVFSLTESSKSFKLGIGAREFLIVTLLPSILQGSAIDNTIFITARGGVFCLAILYMFPVFLIRLFTMYQYFKRLYSSTGGTFNPFVPETKGVETTSIDAESKNAVSALKTVSFAGPDNEIKTLKMTQLPKIPSDFRPKNSNDNA